MDLSIGVFLSTKLPSDKNYPTDLFVANACINGDHSFDYILDNGVLSITSLCVDSLVALEMQYFSNFEKKVDDNHKKTSFRAQVEDIKDVQMGGFDEECCSYFKAKVLKTLKNWGIYDHKLDIVASMDKEEKEEYGCL